MEAWKQAVSPMQVLPSLQSRPVKPKHALSPTQQLPAHSSAQGVFVPSTLPRTHSKEPS